MSHASLLHHAADVSAQFLDDLVTAPVGATATLELLRERLQRGGLADQGRAPKEVIDDMVAAVAGGLIGSAGGRFYGWVIGGTLPSALAADWLTSAWDQNAALFATAPAAAVAEEVAGRWLAELLGVPASASVAFVTGCEMAHVTCLLAARHALLQRRGWDVERDGMAGAPRLRVLAGPHRHGSVDRALRFIGIGTGAVELLAGDDRGRLLPEALDTAFRDRTSEPTIVLLQAGDINTGEFDDFEAVIPVAHKHGGWVHVDGAFGLWAAASPRLAHYMHGAARADSWATDGHKWLNVPYDSGYAFVAHPDAHRAAMTYRASYLTHAADGRDEMDWNPEWSRRARGFATWAALQELGRQGVAALVERCCDHASALVRGIGLLPGAEVACAPILNQGMVRFLAPAGGAEVGQHDRFTDAVIAAVQRGGEAYFTGTTWQGRRAMRVSVSSWRTTDDDVRRSIAAIARVLVEVS